jgi:hypothetical protein
VAFSRHALEELGKDEMSTVDAVNVLRGGVVRPGEYEGGPDDVRRMRTQDGARETVKYDASGFGPTSDPPFPRTNVAAEPWVIAAWIVCLI